MFKDLPAKLVATVAEINQKSRQSFAAEQQEIATKKAATAKLHTFMPKQPAPKADPAAVKSAAKMAEEAEGTIPKTPREKELAAKSGDPKKITQGDVLKARGVKVEGFMSAMKKIGNKVLDTVAPSDEQLLKNLDKSIHGKKAAAPTAPAKPKLKMAHDYVKEDKEKGEKKETAAKEKAEVPEWKKMLNDPYAKEKSAFHSKQISTGTVYSRKYEEVELDEGKMDKMSLSSLWHRHASHSYSADQGYGVGSGSMKNNEHAAVSIENHVRKHYGNKVADDMVHHSDHHVAHAEYAGPAAAKEHEKAAEKLRKKHGITGDLYGNATAIKENMDTPGNSTHQCAIHVKSEQYGEGRTLTTQHAEPDADGYIEWYDVMFAEGIKRVLTSEVEVLESEMHGHSLKKKKKIAEAAETKVHPDAIHVSDAGGGKYKVHAVGKNFSHGIKVGEHLTDTHLDDFSEMGGKIKTVKAPKKD